MRGKFKGKDGLYHVPGPVYSGSLVPPFKAARRARPEESIDLGGLRVRLLSVPGQIKDEVALCDEAQGSLLAGEQALSAAEIGSLALAPSSHVFGVSHVRGGKYRRGKQAAQLQFSIDAQLGINVSAMDLDGLCTDLQQTSNFFGALAL